ncbi:prepilin-type N-terminal cleavage/methylation domain-containing protein [Clostridium sp. DL1XJH146]
MNIKGYTLIELMVILAVFIILSSFILLNYAKLCKKVENYLDVKNCSSEIMTIINESKIKCKINNREGKIVFYENQRVAFKFIVGGIVDSYYIPKEFEFLGKPPTIYINNKGGVAATSTISYFDRYDEKHIISIKVATTYVDIKN